MRKALALALAFALIPICANALEVSSAPEVIRYNINKHTGKASFISFDSESVLSSSSVSGFVADANARSFMASNAGIIGLSKDDGIELMRENSMDDGRTSIRYQQTIEDIPVFGGEMILNYDAKGRISSFTGKLLPSDDVRPKKSLSEDEAIDIALKKTSKEYGIDGSALINTEPEAYIYSPQFLGIPDSNAYTVYRVQVHAKLPQAIDMVYLIDAKSGKIMLEYSDILHAKDRKVYDHENNNSIGINDPNQLKRTEGSGATGITDVDQAYDYAGDTYDFYSTRHGRDSIDNAGMIITSNVRYCTGSCPYANAFWYPSYSQMFFGDGFVVDDVMSHELTHGVTDYESDLVYSYQSGAINEAFSDIWGEFVDLVNGAGNDSASARWLMGEDIPSIGAIRDMQDPGRFGDPDKMTSDDYYCGSGDNGGVHYNSGVLNKAAYLLTDGDTFNGYVIAGIGMNNTAKLFYECQVNLLTSTSDYQDLYTAMLQAASNIGLSPSEQLEVEKAANATEMHTEPCQPDPVTMCGDTGVNNIYHYGFESPTSSTWVHTQLNTSDVWNYSSANPNQGTYSLFGRNPSFVSDSVFYTNFNISLPSAGDSYLVFNHSYDLETSYDGGVVEFSLDGGATWNDSEDYITVNGYTYTISSGWQNPIGGRRAYSGNGEGYLATQINLSDFAGQNLMFRYRIGTDRLIADTGWYIDDFHVFYCNHQPSLYSASVSPSVDDNDTLYNFTVTYRDLDELPPSTLALILDGTTYSMQNTTGDFSSGVRFYYNTSLAVGTHTYFYNATDTINSVSTGLTRAPRVHHAATVCTGTSPGAGTWVINPDTSCTDKYLINEGGLTVSSGKEFNLTRSFAYINTDLMTVDGFIGLEDSSLDFV